jgi:ABC-type transport system substrate-binding protein
VIPTGTGGEYMTDACKVSTKNQKSFTITIEPDIYRSDNTPLSIEDVYFTYNTILKENFRSIPEHDSYKGINIQAYRNSITIDFPFASIDNYLFFTNPILPTHVVSNISYSDYIAQFPNKFVNSSCAKLAGSNHNVKDSIVDLSKCPEQSVKFYQNKSFK